MRLEDHLSPNFTLGELTRSDVAARHSELLTLQRDPPGHVVESLAYLCETVLEPLRAIVGWPLRVTSGYRCADLNRRIGGSPNSQHVLGEAADVEIDEGWLETHRGELLRLSVASEIGQVVNAWSANGVLLGLVADRLNELDIDQCIHEFGAQVGRPSWVHLAASRRQSRRRLTFIGAYTNGRYLDATLHKAVGQWGRAA